MQGIDSDPTSLVRGLLALSVMARIGTILPSPVTAITTIDPLITAGLKAIGMMSEETNSLTTGTAVPPRANIVAGSRAVGPDQLCRRDYPEGRNQASTPRTPTKLRFNFIEKFARRSVKGLMKPIPGDTWPRSHSRELSQPCGKCAFCFLGCVPSPSFLPCPGKSAAWRSAPAGTPTRPYSMNRKSNWRLALCMIRCSAPWLRLTQTAPPLFPRLAEHQVVNSTLGNHGVLSRKVPVQTRT